MKYWIRELSTATFCHIPAYSLQQISPSEIANLKKYRAWFFNDWRLELKTREINCHHPWFPRLFETISLPLIRLLLNVYVSSFCLGVFIAQTFCQVCRSLLTITYLFTYSEDRWYLIFHKIGKFHKKDCFVIFLQMTRIKFLLPFRQ